MHAVLTSPQYSSSLLSHLVEKSYTQAVITPQVWTKGTETDSKVLTSQGKFEPVTPKDHWAFRQGS